MVSAGSADEGRSARNGEVCGQRNNRRGHHEQPPLATNRCKHRRTVHRSSATHFSVACREPAPAVRPTGERLAEQLHPPVVILALGVLDVGLQSKRVLQPLLGEPKRRM